MCYSQESVSLEVSPDQPATTSGSSPSQADDLEYNIHSADQVQLDGRESSAMEFASPRHLSLSSKSVLGRQPFERCPSLMWGLGDGALKSRTLFSPMAWRQVEKVKGATLWRQNYSSLGSFCPKPTRTRGLSKSVFPSIKTQSTKLQVNWQNLHAVSRIGCDRFCAAPYAKLSLFRAAASALVWRRLYHSF